MYEKFKKNLKTYVAEYRQNRYCRLGCAPYGGHCSRSDCTDTHMPAGISPLLDRPRVPLTRHLNLTL